MLNRGYQFSPLLDVMPETAHFKSVRRREPVRWGQRFDIRVAEKVCLPFERRLVGLRRAARAHTRRDSHRRRDCASQKNRPGPGRQGRGPHAECSAGRYPPASPPVTTYRTKAVAESWRSSF
jgi:hypothetical protein